MIVAVDCSDRRVKINADPPPTFNQTTRQGLDKQTEGAVAIGLERTSTSTSWTAALNGGAEDSIERKVYNTTSWGDEDPGKVAQ